MSNDRNRNNRRSRHRDFKSNKPNDGRQPSFSQLSNLRAIACKVVHDVAYQHKSLTTLLPLANEQVAEKDRALLQELVFGTCRWYFHLETLHNEFLRKPLHRNDKSAETLMKIGAYQLHHMRIPNHAALNETVAAAEELGLTNLKGLINAVLRKISDHEFDLDLESSISSHPLWIQEKTKHNWPNNWQQILEQNNAHPPMTLRLNISHPLIREHGRSYYLNLLKESEIEAKACELSSSGISLLNPCQVSNLPLFEEGAVSVQDEAAQLCCDVLAPEPSQKILDACAAPGGKTCALLESVPDLDMLALDIDSDRCKLIDENLSRLSLSANVKTARAEDIDSWWDGEQFDRILLDAPCSATGVIRRHPDIKLLRQESDIKHLAELQLELLTSLWPTLKQGGRLLYATCSIFTQENNRIIERFLKQELSAKLTPINGKWGEDTGFGRQLFPQENGHDGFFYACLTKD